MRQYLIKKLGIEDMEVKVAKMKEQSFNQDDANMQVICGELGLKPMRLELVKPMTFNLPNSDPKIIVEEEIKQYLANGSDVQTVLRSGKIIINVAQAMSYPVSNTNAVLCPHLG